MTEKKPIISVIIPTYNRSELLTRAIDSVFQQSSEEIEIIVSDNCSTDDTQACVRSLMPHSPVPIRYFRHEHNIGMVANWNYALKNLASGIYAIILSDDDFLLDSDYLATAIGLIEDKKPGLIFSRCKVVDSATCRSIERLTFAQKTVQFDEDVEHMEIIRAWCRYGGDGGAGFMIMLQTAIFNRKLVLNKIGGFDQDIISIDIKTWWQIIALKEKIVFVDTFGAAYCIHRDNETKRHPLSVDKWIDNFDCYLKPRLTKNDKLDPVSVHSEIQRIVEHCMLGWPGHIVTIYNLYRTLLLLRRKDPILSKALVRVMLRPRQLLKMIFTVIPRMFEIVSRSYQRYKT